MKERSINLSRFEQDCESAFSLLLWTYDPENDFDESREDHLELKRKWDEAIDRGEMEEHSVQAAQDNFHHWDHGREVPFSRLDCPIIVGKTSDGEFKILDGSHRLLQSIQNKRQTIY